MHPVQDRRSGTPNSGPGDVVTVSYTLSYSSKDKVLTRSEHHAEVEAIEVRDIDRLVNYLSSLAEETVIVNERMKS